MYLLLGPFRGAFILHLNKQRWVAIIGCEANEMITKPKPKRKSLFCLLLLQVSRNKKKPFFRRLHTHNKNTFLAFQKRGARYKNAPTTNSPFRIIATTFSYNNLVRKGRKSENWNKLRWSDIPFKGESRQDRIGWLDHSISRAGEFQGRSSWLIIC